MSRPSIRMHQSPRPFRLLGFSFLLSFACITAYVVIDSHGSFLPWNTKTLIVLPGSFDEMSGTSDNIAKWNASELSQDNRGWLLDPMVAAARAGISGAATTCRAVHIGQIKPGTMRGNHRHHLSNETFIIWGAKTKFRVENPSVKKGYVEVVINADEVAVVGGAAGLAHAVVNIDEDNITHFLGCQDALINVENRRTDYNVWSDW